MNSMIVQALGYIRQLYLKIDGNKLVTICTDSSVVIDVKKM